MEYLKNLVGGLALIAIIAIAFVMGSRDEHKRGCLSNEVPVHDWRELFQE